MGCIKRETGFYFSFTEDLRGTTMRQKSSAYTFLNMIKDVMEIEKTPLTISQIWKCGEKHGLTDKVGSKGKTPINTLQARLYLDIRDNENSIFVQTSKRPSMFYLKDIDVEKREPKLQDDEPNRYNERDLHILLSSYVYVSPEFHCVTKTIYHEKTGKVKKGYNQWLHPDIVGIHFPFDDYSDETLKLQRMVGSRQYKLYSFEMKTVLNFSNLREFYFQAVSNSSWAHEGYLVALEIDEDESFQAELKRLNNAFGIGVIKLNAQNVSQSEVLLSASSNVNLDWDTIDRLSENPDFKQFISDIKDDAEVGKIKSQYDKVYFDDEAAAEYAKKKSIL